MTPVVGVFLAISGCLCTGAAVGQDQVPLVQKAVHVHEVEVEDVGRPVKYLVDNSRLKHKGPGVLWRMSKNMANVSSKSHYVKWNSTVFGTNDGEGWVQVGERFLPIMINGAKVLVQKAGEEETHAEETHAKVELVKNTYVPTEVRAQDNSWIPCNITGVGTQPNTYSITVMPTTFSPYPLDNVPADRLRRIKIIRHFVPVTHKPVAYTKVSGEEVISVSVSYPRGEYGTLKFLRKSPLRVLMKMACDRMSIDWSLCQRSVFFRRGGKKVFPDDTVQGLNLKDGEVLEIVKSLKEQPK